MDPQKQNQNPANPRSASQVQVTQTSPLQPSKPTQPAPSQVQPQSPLQPTTTSSTVSQIPPATQQNTQSAQLPPTFNQPLRKPPQPPVPNSQSNPAPATQAQPINPRASLNNLQAPVTSGSEVSVTQTSSQANTSSNTVNRNAAVQSYINNTEGKNKNAVIFAIVAAVMIVAIAGGGALLFLGGSDDNESNKADSRAAEQQAEAVPPPIPVVVKDSILRSTDSGLSFETYFKVETQQELGLVDVLTVSFHPKVSDEITVSTYDDGLFLNENTGDNWKIVPFEPKRIYSFVLDQANPDTRAFASGIVQENGRIFRTDDKGESWRVVYAEPGLKTYVSALTQDPLSPNVILAGTNKGTLVRSFDSGDTWENIDQDEIRNSIDDFTHDSTRQSFVHLLSKGDVYHSSDAGKSWKNWEEIKEQEIDDLKDRARELRKEGDKDGAEVLNDRADFLEEKNEEQGLPRGIVEIVADPNRSGVIYAGLSKGLYRSTDYGKYWLPVNIIESAERFPIRSVAINPDDSDEISFVSGSSFYRSVNYGQTWAVTPLDKTRNASFVTYDPFDTDTIFIGLSAED